MACPASSRGEVPLVHAGVPGEAAEAAEKQNRPVPCPVSPSLSVLAPQVPRTDCREAEDRSG